MRPLLRPFRGIVWTAGLLLLGFTVISLVPTWMTQVALDARINRSSTQALVAGAVTLLAGAVAALLTYWFRIEAKKVEEAEAAFTGEILAGALRRTGVDVRLGSAAAKAERTDEGLALTLEDGTRIEADRVLLATGRRPRLSAPGRPAARR